MSDSEVVVNLIKYGKEQYQYGYEDGTLNGLEIAMELLLQVGRVGAPKRVEFYRLIKEKAQELDIYEPNSKFAVELESRIRLW